MAAERQQWRSGRPPEHGYYLGAWCRGERWVVSELWFNPDSTGTGWWSSRGYLDVGRRWRPEQVPVQAWMPMPAYPAGDPCEEQRDADRGEEQRLGAIALRHRRLVDFLSRNSHLG